MKFWREIRAALRQGIGLCPYTHERKLRRRGPDGSMGLECADCGRWFPLSAQVRERSRLALRLARQEKKLKARRHAREGAKDPLTFGPRQAPAARNHLPLPTRKEVAHA